MEPERLHNAHLVPVLLSDLGDISEDEHRCETRHQRESTREGFKYAATCSLRMKYWAGHWNDTRSCNRPSVVVVQRHRCVVDEDVDASMLLGVSVYRGAMVITKPGHANQNRKTRFIEPPLSMAALTCASL